MQAISLMCAHPVPTLIVCPVAMVGTWRDALMNFGRLRPIIVNSSFKGILPPGADTVVTAYSSFQFAKGGPPKCLAATKWGRIICDEGHLLRNHKTRVNKEISSLDRTHTWILSGTPINNSDSDLRTLVRFIGADASGDIEEMYKKYVLRRTQEGEAAKNPRLALPKLTTIIERVPFKYPEERDLYDRVEKYYKTKLENVTSMRRYTAAVEGMMRMRQVCTHPLLYLEGIDRKTKNKGKKRAGGGARAKAGPKKRAKTSAAAAAAKDEDDGDDGSDDDEFDMESPPRPKTEILRSSKMDFLTEAVSEFLGADGASTSTGRRSGLDAQPKKCLIFSQWTTEARLIKTSLQEKGIASLIYDGSSSRDSKDTILDNFKASSINVLILQIVAGGVGLNLQQACRLFILSPSYNPVLDAQAISRIYRKGQMQEVSCIRLIVSDTVEERCMDIQNAKMDYIAETMSDETMKNRLQGYGQDGRANAKSPLGDGIDDTNMLALFEASATPAAKPDAKPEASATPAAKTETSATPAAKPDAKGRPDEETEPEPEPEISIVLERADSLTALLDSITDDQSSPPITAPAPSPPIATSPFEFEFEF